MACRGVYFAISDKQTDKVLELSQKDKALIDYIKTEIEGAGEQYWLCETDKAWDAIHRCLTDGKLTMKPLTLEHQVVLGGAKLCRRNNYIVSFVEKQVVSEISEVLVGLTEQHMRSQYVLLGKTEYKEFMSEDDFEYTWSYFNDIRNFYKKAACANRAVIFTVDQ